MITRALVTAIVATAAIPNMVPPASAAISSEAETATDADTRFKTVSEAEYAWRKSLWPSDEDTTKGERRGLPDVGPAMQATKLRRWTETAAALEAIAPAKLSPRVRADYLVYKAQIDALLAEQRYREYEKPLNADSSFWGEVAGAARESYRTEEGYRHYLKTLGQVPRYFDQQIVNMRAGLKRGFTPPRITLEGRDIGVAEVVKVGGREASAFYAPFKSMPSAIPAATQAALRADARRVIAEAVVPAHAKLLAFLRQEYLPGARTTLAAYALPDGEAYYRSKIREFVTRDMTADEIHAVGLAEVAKIKARMHEVMRDLKYEGDLAAFLSFLRTDPRFYAKTPQQLLDRAAWIAKTFDGKADDWFGRLPRARFAIKPVPDELAPFYTGGRGGPGIYLVNTYNLPARPLYSLVALTLHESAPGHAFQMPLAAELEDLPAYRRETYISAYGEGWALYSEALGEDMGMYETPYDRFGMLSYQMWRAARLVVDTGIHAKGWTREQAQAFVRDNTALSNHEITTEVDRYIAWPGQALSYYMGELAFLAGRAKAEKALGARFDIRAFHDAMLALGSVPLPLVDARVDQFIAEGGKGPYPLK